VCRRKAGCSSNGSSNGYSNGWAASLLARAAAPGDGGRGVELLQRGASVHAAPGRLQEGRRLQESGHGRKACLHFIPLPHRCAHCVSVGSISKQQCVVTVRDRRSEHSKQHGRCSTIFDRELVNVYCVLLLHTTLQVMGSYWDFMRPTYAQDKGDIQADMYSTSNMYLMIVIGRHVRHQPCNIIALLLLNGTRYIYYNTTTLQPFYY
jgi:hypothetical protein